MQGRWDSWVLATLYTKVSDYSKEEGKLKHREFTAYRAFNLPVPGLVPAHLTRHGHCPFCAYVPSLHTNQLYSVTWHILIQLSPSVWHCASLLAPSLSTEETRKLLITPSKQVMTLPQAESPKVESKFKHTWLPQFLSSGDLLTSCLFFPHSALDILIMVSGVWQEEILCQTPWP